MLPCPDCHQDICVGAAGDCERGVQFHRKTVVNVQFGYVIHIFFLYSSIDSEQPTGKLPSTCKCEVGLSIFLHTKLKKEKKKKESRFHFVCMNFKLTSASALKIWTS